jgi:Asp-tRNA(Asn)/Glu-tRNA(Gln) amidotransferase A subunit family amidase
MIDLTTQTARTIAESVRRRELTAVAVTQSALERIEQLNRTLRAFITVTRDLALAAAAEVDRKIAAGQGNELPLAGVPLAVKDSYWTKGIRTTGGTKVFANFVPDEDATVVARLKAAGCVVVGKSAMHEMAYGFTSRNPHYGDCLNPWDTTRIPGGSSGGNAAALASGMVLAAVGGDTGGSNRQPAALCGVIGVKVTYGRVSRYGGIPLSWSMDTVGPMSRTVGDSAALLQVTAGHDPKDPATRRGAVPDYLAALAGGLRGIRIGVPHDQFMAMMEPDVGAAIQDALGVLKQNGATLVDVRFPSLEPVVGAHRAIIFCEAAAAHEELIRTRAAELSDEVRPLLQSGLFLTASQYLGAQQARRNVIAAYRSLWRSFDVLVTPTSPIAAPVIGTTTARLGGNDIPLVRAFLDLTLPFNLTGQPAISVPCGFTRGGLPIGLQLVGRPFDEATLFRAGAAYEAATEWHSRKPPIAAGGR